MNGYTNPILAVVCAAGAVAFLCYAAVVWVGGLMGWLKKNKSKKDGSSSTPSGIKVIRGRFFGNKVAIDLREGTPLHVEDSEFTENERGIVHGGDDEKK